MIARVEGGVSLADVQALFAMLDQRRAITTIRARCTPIASDIATRRLLFDPEDVIARLADVPMRAPHRRSKRAA